MTLRLEALAALKGVRFPAACRRRNDNRLFGITAQIAWMPKLSYQVTLRTPLYAVRN